MKAEGLRPEMETDVEQGPAEEPVAQLVAVPELAHVPATAATSHPVERVSWFRRIRSLIALVLLSALLGATLAAVVIGVAVLIALAAQHAPGLNH